MAVACSALIAGVAMAGNPDRAGSAGATQLLVNPWARSNGWSLANTSTLEGAEGMFGNVAGLAHIHKTELLFTSTDWLDGSGVKVNSVGFGQKLGESGVIGISATTFSFGDIPVTTVDQPEGGLGTFSPTQANIGFAYAKAFSNSIYGGLLIRVVSESISNVRAPGVCFDAGIQYVTGPTENVHFGISLKNVGPAMKFEGDGLAAQSVLTGGTNTLTLEQRSAEFELPSMMNIGAAYDFHLSELNRITLAGNFTSNSFTKDQFIIGVEYAFKKMLHIRGGYLYEKNSTDEELRETVFTGPSGGISLDFPFGNEKQSVIALDYAYRATHPFNGVHCIGVRLTL
jgi:hypothetical protein